MNCDDRNKLTFATLKQSNVTISNLYQWNAPFDIQNDYARYLYHNSEAGDQAFCNCTPPWFGIQCEYRMESISTSFMSLVEAQFDAINRKKSPNIGCYIGLTCLNNDQDCLDWRQICNGIRDCEGGEDEKHCIEMEMNECNTATEYRCQNGMCIDRSFLVDFVFDCMDESDENPSNSLANDGCYTKRSFECEERMCAWMKTSCGDGQSRYPRIL
ncbi:unnamed protein product [Rotaria sp. Silwood1]|nr:unnamed protein product [Rotaria sp. Silwood1]